jgi:putative chitinase
MKRDLFFDRIRQSLFDGKMSAVSVRGVEAVLSAWEGAPTRFAAYGLATAFGEVGRDMQPVREGFTKTEAEFRAYLKKHYWTMKSGKPGYARPVGPFQQVYGGRGYVQLTWLANYQKAQDELGMPFVRNPDLALIPANAALIMRRGMEQGWFTGKKLADYLTNQKTDYVNARRIINGTDRAREIAGYAIHFENALRAGGWGKGDAQPPVVTQEPARTIEAKPKPTLAPTEAPEKAQPANEPASPPADDKPPISTKSRTVQGAGSVVVAGGGVIAEATGMLETVKGYIDGSTIGLLLGGLAIAGGVYAIYARWHDGGGRFPWQKGGG